MLSAIILTSITIPRPPHKELSSARVLMAPGQFVSASFPIRSLNSTSSLSLTIRMGGGPRTFPGGVSKWQWKRMQAKKAKQLLKARLCRERQIYEMRKRAELKAAVLELERPWEVVERAPTLFSVKADEQVKVLADRFQKPGGFDMWSERDGPQVFRTPDGLLSARFFPKGVVHSVKPYGVIGGSTGEMDGSDGSENEEESQFDGWIGMDKNRSRRRSKRSSIGRGRVGSNNEVDGEVRDLSSSTSSDSLSAEEDTSLYLKARNAGPSNARYRRDGNAAEFSRRGVAGGSDRENSSRSNLTNLRFSSGSNGGNCRSMSRGNVGSVGLQRSGRDTKGTPHGSSRSQGNWRQEGRRNIYGLASDGQSTGTDEGGGVTNRYNSIPRRVDTRKVVVQAKFPRNRDAHSMRDSEWDEEDLRAL